MNDSSPAGALLVVAHGATHPGAAALVMRQATRAAALGGFSQVATGFHVGSPSWAEALESLDSVHVTVVPFLTSSGYFASRVLPRALQAHPAARTRTISLGPPVGDDPRVPHLIAAQARARFASLGWSPAASALMLVGHGTRRHPHSRLSCELAAGRLAEERTAGTVLTAYLDDDPPLETVLQQVQQPRLLIHPYLIGGGTHATVDILRALGVRPRPDGVHYLPGARQVVLDTPFGHRPELAELIINSARAALPLRTRKGVVHLVGAGPGAGDLITVRGRRVLRRADVVLHDRLVDRAVLRLAGPSAQLVNVGKAPGRPFPQDEINRLLVHHALLGHRVVRLKGGDPGVFGRADEELEACRAQGIRVAVIPGVSSVMAGAAAAGFPLTMRGVARSLAVVTAQVGDEDGLLALAPVAHADTLVLLMGRASLRLATAELVRVGRDPATPAAIVERASLAGSRTVRGTLETIADLADAAGVASPAVTYIGVVTATHVDRREAVQE